MIKRSYQSYEDDTVTSVTAMDDVPVDEPDRKKRKIETPPREIPKDGSSSGSDNDTSNDTSNDASNGSGGKETNTGNGSGDNGSVIDENDLAYMFNGPNFNHKLVQELYTHVKNINVLTIDDLIEIGTVFRRIVHEGFHAATEYCNVGDFCGCCAGCMQVEIMRCLGITISQFNTYRKLARMIIELQDISCMIGLDEIKEQFMEQLMYLSSNTDTQNPLMHTVITGPPGHGKTHIATLISSAYKKSGFLKNDKFIVAKRADLIGAYCGHTAKNTTKMFNIARGGVIFIDEVYSLGNEEKGDVFTKECIDTINQLLSERPDTMCIIAGYEKEINTRFFSYNPGLARRFPWRLNITPYVAADLVRIFYKMLNDDKWGITDQEILREKDLLDDIDLFDNAGGDIATLITNCKIQHYRCSFLNNQQTQTLTREDVLAGLNKFKVHKKRTSTKEEPIELPPPPYGMYN